MNFQYFKILRSNRILQILKLKLLIFSGKKEGKIEQFNDGDSRFHDYKKILMKQ